MTNLDKICFQLCGKLGILAEMKDVSHCNFFPPRALLSLQNNDTYNKTLVNI